MSSKPVFNKQHLFCSENEGIEVGLTSVTLSDLLIKQLFPCDFRLFLLCSKVPKKGVFYWYHNENATEMKIETNIFE